METIILYRIYNLKTTFMPKVIDIVVVVVAYL